MNRKIILGVALGIAILAGVALYWQTGFRKAGLDAIERDLAEDDAAAVAEEAKAHARCVQARVLKKTYASEKEARDGLLQALEKKDVEALTSLLPCGVWIGVPGSEYDPLYKLEDLAKYLAAKRNGTFSSSGEAKLYTEGYTDGLMYRFEFANDASAKGWQVRTILYGKKEDVLASP